MEENCYITDYVLPEKLVIDKKTYTLVCRKVSVNNTKTIYTMGYWNAKDIRWAYYISTDKSYHDFVETGFDKQKVLYALKKKVYYYEQYIKNKNRR